MRRHLEGDTGWLVVVLAAACLLGAVIGVTAFPAAWPQLAAMTSAQLGVTAFGVLAPRRPVLWAVAVAVVGAGSALVDSRLSELAYSGAIPFITLSTAAATFLLYRYAADWIAIASGTAALGVGLGGLVAVGVRAGIPPATAVTAASVHLLIGVVGALVLHLRDARDDRVRRPELRVDAGPLPAGDGAGGPPAPGDLDRARRALAIVALRSDELVAATDDLGARRAAADLREVARRGLTGGHRDDQSIARIELRPVPPVPPPGPADRDAGPAGTVAAPAMPELPDREREVLRLVATGASNAVIGRKLYLSEATVKQYVSRLMRRFERENRTQLAIMAARWFDADDPDDPG